MKRRLLIDAEVVAAIFKGLPSALYYEKVMLASHCAISFQTFSELQIWMKRSDWSQERQAQFEHYLTQYVVIYADHAICSIWAEICRCNSAFGEPVNVANAWIGATALALECPLVTERPSEFLAVNNLSFVTNFASSRHI